MQNRRQPAGASDLAGRPAGKPTVRNLTKRAEGKSTRQIAEEVGCDNKTVHNVIKSTVENSTVETPAEITGKDGKKLDEHPEAKGLMNLLHGVVSCRTV